MKAQEEAHEKTIATLTELAKTHKSALNNRNAIIEETNANIESVQEELRRAVLTST